MHIVMVGTMDREVAKMMDLLYYNDDFVAFEIEQQVTPITTYVVVGSDSLSGDTASTERTDRILCDAIFKHEQAEIIPDSYFNEIMKINYPEYYL